MYEVFIQGKAFRVMGEWYNQSGNAAALDIANKMSEYLRNYNTNGFWRSPDTAKYPDGNGYFVGQSHSYLQVVLGLLNHAQALRKSDPNSALATAEVGLANAIYSFIKTRSRAGLVGNFGEIGTTGDMILVGIKLTEMGAGNYYEEVDAWTRNALVEAQIDDAAASQISNAPTRPCRSAPSVALQRATLSDSGRV